MRRVNRSLAEAELADTLLIALLPLFFVLALGYAAGHFQAFDADQASGMNKLVATFALPAMLFASTVRLTRPALTSDLRFFAASAAAYLIGLGIGFLIARFLFRRTVAEAGIAGLCFASPAAPFFGTSILPPLFGAAVADTIPIAALAINLMQVPLAMVVIAGTAQTNGGAGGKSNLLGALTQPVVLAPIAAVIIVLSGLTLPQSITASVALIGSATSGIAVFVAGLTLAAHRPIWSAQVWTNVGGKLIVVPLLVLAASLALGIKGTPLGEAVVTGSISAGLIGIILASRYKIYVEEAATVVLASALGMVASLPLWVFVTR